MLTYQLDFEKYHAHLVRVQLSLSAPSDNPILYLPSWVAGSYMIRELAKNIPNVQYKVNGTSMRANKLSKNEWQFTANQGDTLNITYDVYCYDLSVRTAYVDSERIFGNFSSFLLMPKGDEYAPCTIDLLIPQSFYKNKTKLAIGLPFDEQKNTNNVRYHFNQLPNGKPLAVFESLDFPFEIGNQDCFEFYVQNNDKQIAHRFFISGIYTCNFDRLKADLNKICQAYADTLGWVPFDNYTFMTYASKDGYGGLEHINSTALMTPRDDLPKIDEGALPNDDYQRFLGLCSHEYFHSWWVKSVRPDVMMTSLLHNEAYTPLLWVFEGFTSYVDDVMLYRSGVIDEASYLKLLAGQITRYLNTEGRHHQTVAESSFDAWIKLYRPDENSQNSTVSYYNKGAIVAWGLDLLLSEYGYTLFDVVREFVNLAKNTANARFGMSDANLDEIMVKFLPADIWTQFKNNYINGVCEIPFEKWLNKQDLILNIAQKDEPFGIIYENNANGLLIKRLSPYCDASRAGLSANDMIVAIDYLKADGKELQNAYQKAKTGQNIQIHAFRRDVLLTFMLNSTKDNPSFKAKFEGRALWLDK